MNNIYRVKKLENIGEIKVQAPGSKSITNRALLLAAISGEKCRLRGVLFSDDSRAFLESLIGLGFQVDINEEEKEVTVRGTGGKIPDTHGKINVRSAGTAARFLTVMLALAGGEYELAASPQMCRRPMEPLLHILQEAGVRFDFQGEEGHFPFSMSSPAGGFASEEKGEFSLAEVKIDTGVSSQFASALLMAGVLLPGGLTVTLEGARAESPYINMTIAMMKQFGIEVRREGRSCHIPHKEIFGCKEYRIEPDVSGACYFYAMAPLLKTDVIVNNVHENSLQGDIRFLDVLERMGCRREDTNEGIRISGSRLLGYPGIDVSMRDFSDQTMTLAALAPFAEGPVLIRDVGHIRLQESDRIAAILTELGRMGISCEEAPECGGIRIFPGEVMEAEAETYEDHQRAMAFTLIGLKTGKIAIKNPGCCRKTFENYFELIETLYEQRK